ncbi:ABC transporter permease [Candidatus Cyanaurora vandensis]|uniref:ABC transporter permease n=1 Tax=Candidatus Cyanaurora vandensis TaxID=2714958 RepID=UPI00257FCE30|nr:ABC transporter permease [Candidatus Cyanaurora vandensis]
MTIAPALIPKTQRFLELLYVLTARNLKVRYRGSLLGVYWSLLNPVIMTGVYTAVFGTTFAAYYDNSVVNYVLAAFTGLVVISFFNSTTAQALPSVVRNGTLLNKIRLPIGVLPLSMVMANVFQFMVGAFPLLAIITLWVSGNPFHVLLLLLPVLALVIVTTGVSYILSGLYVFFRDLPYLYELVTFILLISSPVFYPAEIVPPLVQPFLALNPLSPIIESIRQLALKGETDLNQIGAAWVGSLVIAGLGWVAFRSWYDQFMDLL